jgi:hypothetical protein
LCSEEQPAHDIDEAFKERTKLVESYTTLRVMLAPDMTTDLSSKWI